MSNTVYPFKETNKDILQWFRDVHLPGLQLLSARVNSLCLVYGEQDGTQPVRVAHPFYQSALLVEGDHGLGRNTQRQE